ncbi:MAG: hypothetical protein PVI23_10850 [Maricaulaceae bacterium]
MRPSILFYSTCAAVILAIPADGDEPADAEAGTVIANARLRSEFVDQEGFADDASALTLRLRLGYETAPLHGVVGLIEFEQVETLVDDYNSTTNGVTTRPVIADPEGTELNRLQLTWTTAPFGSVAVGRQRLVHDDARFLGDVGFRQNQQTLDALNVNANVLERIDVNYAYINRVQRIFGPESPVGSVDSDSHALRASVSPADDVEVVAYAYLLDFETALPSSDTYGARVSAQHELNGDWRIEGLGEFANQSPAAAGAGDLDYWRVSGGLRRGPLGFSARREQLSGDGVRGFSTPLATLHAFQGWADAFLATPADGLADTAVSAQYAFDLDGPVSRIALTGVAHDFESDRNTRDFGSELDLRLVASLPHGLSLEAKGARFEGDNGFADRDKFWLGMSWRR